MEYSYIVYVQTDLNDIITAINSSEFLTDIDGWMQVDEGIGDKYHHAQGNYLQKGLVDEAGSFNYKLVEGVVTERTESEKQDDIANIPPALPSSAERLESAEAAILILMEVLG